MRQIVRVSTLVRNDKFSFLTHPDIYYTFLSYNAEFDYILYKSNTGKLDIASVCYGDEVYKYLEYRVTKVTDITIDCEFERSCGILSKITQNLKHIEVTENCTVESLVLKPSFNQRKFSLADSCYLHNEKECVIITLNSENYKKPYCFTLKKSKKS